MTENTQTDILHTDRRVKSVLERDRYSLNDEHFKMYKSRYNYEEIIITNENHTTAHKTFSILYGNFLKYRYNIFVQRKETSIY